MSAVSTSRQKKSDPLSKKVHENPKYKHVRAMVDTGASITKYMEKIEDIRSNYRYKKDEIFKRMKITTFVQLIAQVAEYENLQTPSLENGSYRPDTADEEVYMIQKGGGDRSPAPSLAVTEGDYGAPAENDITCRSTLQRVIKGEGELDRQRGQPSNLDMKILEGCPYLLLDIRDKDCFDQCHIITAKSYPSAMLSRACNYETKDMLAFRNQPGKIIIVYDENEQLAHNSITTLVQRGYDNVFLLSGGVAGIATPELVFTATTGAVQWAQIYSLTRLTDVNKDDFSTLLAIYSSNYTGMKVAYRLFPDGLFSGTPPITVTETPRPTTVSESVKKDKFSNEDLEKIGIYLDNALFDKSTGSRLSKASTASSRTGNNSATSKLSKPSQSVLTGRASHQQPFKP